jgi:hypothetical protein
VGNRPLLFDSNYITPLGDTFSVTKFKFFVGNPILTYKKINDVSSQNNYFLINQMDTASQTISFQVINNFFTHLAFSIGVDSAKNVNGVQTGALDPATGMFWTWNSGYIVAKLEGKSPNSKAPFSNITYHIGGFRKTNNAVREISMPLKKEYLDDTSLIKIQASEKIDRKHLRLSNIDTTLFYSYHCSEIVININVDLNKWFDGPHPIKIAEKSFCMSPGKIAMEIADNYANMFSIKSIGIK